MGWYGNAIVEKNKTMKIIKLLLLTFCLLFGLQNIAKSQTVYWTEEFETGLPTGSSGAYATHTAVTISSGTWSFLQSYSHQTGCNATRGLRFIGSQSGYAVTPSLPNGVSKISLKFTQASRSVTVLAKTTDSGDDNGWTSIGTIASGGACTEVALLSTAFNGGLDPSAIRRIKLVKVGTSDTNIDGVSITSSSGSPVISSDTEVTAFKLPGQVGNEAIDFGNGTIKLNIASGTSLTNTAPSTFTISSGATVSPLATALQDFTSPVIYVITAQDGTTVKSWTVTTSIVQSSEKEITAFKLSNAQIGNASINSSTGQILVTMPIGENLTSLSPVTFTLSNSATVNPTTNTARDFSAPVSYMVTAQNGSTKQWTVSVVTVDPNLTFIAYQAESADYTGKVDAQHTGFTGTGFIDFLAAGENQITFTTCNQVAGVQTAKFRYAFAKDESRSAELYVNDVFIQNIDFPRTATFTDWAEAIVSVNLNAGVNKIKLTWETTDGPNLDKLDLSGSQCQSYTLNVNATNNGTVALNPVRANNSYFAGETVTLLAEEKPALKLDNWSGDLNGATNPQTISMNANKTVTANFRVINTYKVNVATVGIGTVTLSPAGGEYADGTVVTATAATLMGSVFQGWSGDLIGNNASQQIIVGANKNITATFTDNFNIDFKKIVGFASISADGFTGPTTGGEAVIAGRTKDVVYINGPSEFGKLCEILQKRIKYKTYSNNPLTIVLEAGTYTGAGGKESVWGNSMLTIQEQENLTIIGRKNVIFNFGINIKRSSNLIIRNITFQDYYDDGINVGETETHHVWIDHCTVGHPLARPANTEHPDGGIDIKNGASYVTVSWTLYRNSWKTGLVGHSDSNGGTDGGRLKVTYFGNYFYNSNSRNPRVRFGEVHVLNNLEEKVSLYGIAASNNSSVYAEGNFFLNTRWPMYGDRALADFRAIYGNNTDDAFTSKTGNKPATGLKQVDNDYDDSGLPVITSQINATMLNPGGRSIRFDEFNPQNVFTPANYYTYTALPASVVKVVVPMYAGADKVEWFPEALPLDLLAFEAKNVGTNTTPQVAVTWKTTNEVNTEKFEVLRRTDNTAFEVINVQASKNAAGVHNYSYVDKLPLSGKSYYQLKQYDKDGKSTTSDVKLVTIAAFLSAFEAYPNPTDGWVTIKHDILTTEAEVVIADLQGRKQFSQKVMKGEDSTKINLSSLFTGMYLVTLTNEGKKQTLKIVKR